MRGFGIALLIATVGLPLAAGAQPQQDQSPNQSVIKSPPVWNLTPEDKQAYCFWAGQIYSIGSSFCTRQQTVSTCTATSGGRPIWVTKDNDKACDKNPSLTPL